MAASAVSQLLALLVCLLRALARALLDSLRLLSPLRRPSPPLASCAFYEGLVHHQRSLPLPYAFSHNVRYCLIDLEGELPSYVKEGGRLSADEARRLVGSRGKVHLLLIPASAGFEENPIAVYYCRGEGRGEGVERVEGELECCIAEVTNTPWGDRVRFAFDPKGDEVGHPSHSPSPLPRLSPLSFLASWSVPDVAGAQADAREPPAGHEEQLGHPM